MSIVINAIKARLALLAIVNAIGLVLSGMGKVSQETLQLWTEQVGNIFDWCLLIFGSLALLLPSISKYIKIDRNIAHMLMVALMLPLMLVSLTACENLRQATLLDENGNPIKPPTTLGINLGGLFPAPPKPSPTPPPIMQAQTPILPGLTVEK